MLFREPIFITTNLFGKMLCNVVGVFCIVITYKKILRGKNAKKKVCAAVIYILAYVMESVY